MNKINRAEQLQTKPLQLYLVWVSFKQKYFVQVLLNTLKILTHHLTSKNLYKPPKILLTLRISFICILSIETALKRDNTSSIVCAHWSHLKTSYSIHLMVLKRDLVVLILPRKRWYKRYCPRTIQVCFNPIKNNHRTVH